MVRRFVWMAVDQLAAQLRKENLGFDRDTVTRKHRLLPSYLKRPDGACFDRPFFHTAISLRQIDGGFRPLELVMRGPRVRTAVASRA